jgi:hypothetical protein
MRLFDGAPACSDPAAPSALSSAVAPRHDTVRTRVINYRVDHVAGKFIYRDTVHLRRNLRSETISALAELFQFRRFFAR